MRRFFNRLGCNLGRRLGPAWIQVLTAMIALLIGVAVYWFDRQPERVYFIPDAWSTGAFNGTFFGSVGLYLPTFTHTFGFSLLTAVVLRPSRWSAAAGCLLWGVTGSLFEVAQTNSMASWIARNLPVWFNDWPVLDNATNYFLAGAFDPLDLLSVFLGALLAWRLLVATNRLEHEAQGI
ncbi:MAG: hypothetical protein OEU86_00080 [Gammaproteobacteria bacterium]|nr:hypothetical protein [Gammaproteobacteria bacterium]